MKLLNEKDVHECYHTGDITVAHAVDLISQHLKKICDVGGTSIINFNPENVVNDLSEINDIENLQNTMELEHCVLDEVRGICERIVNGSIRRQNRLEKWIKNIEVLNNEVYNKEID